MSLFIGRRAGLLFSFLFVCRPRHLFVGLDFHSTQKLFFSIDFFFRGGGVGIELLKQIFQEMAL